jgi:hypothetical protein
VEDDDLRWTWYDSLSGTPGEDELPEPPRTFTYMPTTIDPDALKAKLAALAATNAKPEHWARRIARRIGGKC